MRSTRNDSRYDNRYDDSNSYAESYNTQSRSLNSSVAGRQGGDDDISLGGSVSTFGGLSQTSSVVSQQRR